MSLLATDAVADTERPSAAKRGSREGWETANATRARVTARFRCGERRTTSLPGPRGPFEYTEFTNDGTLRHPAFKGASVALRLTHIHHFILATATNGARWQSNLCGAWRLFDLSPRSRLCRTPIRGPASWFCQAAWRLALIRRALTRRWTRTVSGCRIGWPVRP
jgi:hypothetical protein